MVTEFLGSHAAWSPILLGAARGFGLVLFLPLGWDLIGVTQRLALMFAIAFGIPVEGVQFSVSSIAWFWAAGVLVGLPIALAADVAGSLGEIFDVGRGVMIAEVLDPLQSVSASHLAVLARYSIWICFLASGGMAVLLPALARAGTTQLHSAESLREFGQSGYLQVGGLFSEGLSLVFPILLTFLLVEFAVGIVSKVSANISLTLEASILKLVVSTVCLVQLLDWIRPTELVSRLYG